MAAKILAFPTRPASSSPPAPTTCIRWQCTQPPTDTSAWCQRHRYCAELMAWGATIGYPELYLNPSLFVQRGYEEWLYYAARFYPDANRARESARAACVERHIWLTGKAF